MSDNIQELIAESINKEEIFYTVTDLAMEKEIDNGFEDLTPIEKNSFMVGKLLQELNNGGFDQYFLNTEGKYANDTVYFLESIGENSISRILDEGNSIFKAIIPDDYKMEEFEKLDIKVYNLSSLDYDILYEKYVKYLEEMLGR